MVPMTRVASVYPSITTRRGGAPFSPGTRQAGGAATLLESDTPTAYSWVASRRTRRAGTTSITLGSQRRRPSEDRSMADPTAHKRSPTSESATDLDANDEDKARAAAEAEAARADALRRE